MSDKTDFLNIILRDVLMLILMVDVRIFMI